MERVSASSWDGSTRCAGRAGPAALDIPHHRWDRSPQRRCQGLRVLRRRGPQRQAGGGQGAGRQGAAPEAADAVDRSRPQFLRQPPQDGRRPALQVCYRGPDQSLQRHRRGVPQMRLHGVLQERQSHLVQAQGAEQRMALQACHPRRVARHHPGLRAAEQLVAAEAHQRGAAGQRLLRQRFPRQAGTRVGRRHRPAAQVHHQRHVRRGRGIPQLGQPRRGHEPLHHEVAAVHRQQRRRAGATGGGVIRHGGLVGGPDLAQAAARGGEDLGNAEPAPDLDQLAARDHHLAALGIVADGRHHQQQRGRAVVDHGRGRRLAQGRQRLFHVAPAAAALARWRGPAPGSCRRRPPGRRASIAAPSGARPRLVCSRTPVALITGRRRASASRSAAARTRATIAARSGTGAVARTASSSRRTRSAHSACGSPRSARPSSNWLTGGIAASGLPCARGELVPLLIALPRLSQTRPNG